mmetsp:Transcript_83247/g.254506  ORF Transcript_83247/g.254506 Transcript_83247/m.254506 type:complete len:289 (+) Transcript_83247:356-1222(+)
MKVLEGVPSGLKRNSKDSSEEHSYLSYSLRIWLALFSFQFGGCVTFRPMPTGFRSKRIPCRTATSLFDMRPGHKKTSSPFGMSRRAIWTTTSCSFFPSSTTSSWKGKATEASGDKLTCNKSLNGNKYMRGMRASRTSWCGWTTRACRMITAVAHVASARPTGASRKKVRFPAVSRMRSRFRAISSYAPSTVVPFSTRRWRSVSSSTVRRSPWTASSHSRKTVSGSRFSAIRGYAKLRRWALSSPVTLNVLASVDFSNKKSFSSLLKSAGSAVSMLNKARLGILTMERP